MARPAAFDREQVLGQATAAFWEHGYFSTSINQLVEATRLQPGSLYAAFGSKEGLLLAVLDHYAAHSLGRLQTILAGAVDPLDGIETFFEQLAREGGGGARRRGCLLVNTVLEVGRHNPVVQARVAKHLEEIEETLRTALEAAQAQGLVAAGKSPRSLARFLMTTIWGLRVLGGTGADADSARQVVQEALSALRA
jgi:TetR/AcrR family transcriptional repressor of nem operon